MTVLGAVLLGGFPVACDGGGSEPSEDGGVSIPDAGASELTVTVLGTGQATLEGEVWTYQLLRLEEAGKAPAYAQWFPPRSPGAWPVMVLTRPYDGIAWTGEAVDERWAARPNGLYLDDSEPNFDGGAHYIAYSQSTPETVASEALLYLRHDFGVLAIFGRFYAGGSIQNDRDDMHAGMRFLTQAEGVDRERIGIVGGSWGGFEALYAAADAPAEVRPKVGVALYPLSDFEHQVNYLDVTVPARVSDPAVRFNYETFFEPYSRRIFATTGGRPNAPGADYRRWTAAHVASTLEVPFLVVHEDRDALVPYEQTQALVAAAGSRVTPLYVLHGTPADWNTSPLNHGPLVETYAGAITPIYLGHLLTALASPTQHVIVPYLQAHLRTWLQDVRDLKRQGLDMEAAAPRLHTLTDARVLMVEVSAGRVVSGAALMAEEVNAVWGTPYTATTIRDALGVGLPP
ncbi:prolyl oligopeptidase family serine peptidase [Myxococcus sp. SDU36]|uniref:alpha/beta hydrolase family protein n=1 Tax=Myxococcus sp. SDU36 TaxID=2831967 RepID=UPI002543E2CB|nr:prolyl oligopeptidase family serine peptidase [Myxococcus sp. SDU36]WIG95201.1 S9 family peptidase [Myxococcus sp. SDU36]